MTVVRDDGATTACPVCGTAFEPKGRQKFCSTGCRQSAWRAGRRAPVEPVVTRSGTVYECPACEARYLGFFSIPSGRETIASARSAKSCKGFWGRRRKLDVGYRCIARRPMTTDGRTAAEVVIMLAGDLRLVQARRSRDGARWG